MAEWSLRHRMIGADQRLSELVQHPDQLHLGMPGSPMVLQILLRISQAVLGANFLDEALEAIAEETRIVTRGSSVSISRWEPDIDSLRTLISVGELGRGELRWPDSELYRVSGNLRLTELLRYGRPYSYSIDDSDIPISALEQLKRLGKESAAAVPLSHGDSVWGEMWVSGTGGRRFDHDDIQLLQAIASYATIAIGRAELFSATWRAARLDPLTGLANRRALDERMAQIDWSEGQHTVLVCDLDGFKSVNDREGHAAGDTLLCSVAAILRTAIVGRPGAMAARLGGDEFCILLPAATMPDAEALVSDINSAINVELSGRVAATWGAAEHTWVGATGWDLLHAADTALQHAKSLGKARFSYVTAPQIIQGPRNLTADGNRRSGDTDDDLSTTLLTARVVQSLDERRPESALAGLEVLARQAHKRIGSSAWALMVLHPETSSLITYRQEHERRQEHEGSHRLLPTHELNEYPAIAQAISTGLPLFCDVDGRAKAEAAMLASLGYRVMLLLPVSRGERSYVVAFYANRQATLAPHIAELRVLAHYCVSMHVQAEGPGRPPN